jgi:hypothetical protein
MRISKFSEFDKINEEEGWKENILVGLLSILGVSAFGQKGEDVGSRRTFHTKQEASLPSLIKRGWSLDSVKVDTLFNEVKEKAPQDEMMVTRIKLDKDQYFQSGKFELSQEVSDSIYNSLASISNDNGVITDIVIVSSTDKQKPSANLRNLLSSKGYTPDNQGLSRARSESISTYMGELGINNSLIQTEQKYEQGEAEIEQSARYVSVDIYYIKPEVTEPREPKPEQPITKTYYLSKEKGSTDTGSRHKFKGGFKFNFGLGPIKHHRRTGKNSTYLCPTWGNKQNPWG